MQVAARDASQPGTVATSTTPAPTRISAMRSPSGAASDLPRLASISGEPARPGSTTP